MTDNNRFLTACQRGDLKTVKMLMKKSGLEHRFGLWLAAQADRDEVVVCLLDTGLVDDTTDALEIAGPNTKRAMKARLEYSTVYDIKETVTSWLAGFHFKVGALKGMW